MWIIRSISEAHIFRAGRHHGSDDRILQGSMLGDETAYAKAPRFWPDQDELTLQVAALADPDRPFQRRDLGDGAFILFQTVEAGGLVEAAGIGEDLIRLSVGLEDTADLIKDLQQAQDAN